jgi:hypothetical protein
LLGTLPFTLREFTIFASVSFVGYGSLAGCLCHVHACQGLLAFSLAKGQRLHAGNSLPPLYGIAFFGGYTHESS